MYTVYLVTISFFGVAVGVSLIGVLTGGVPSHSMWQLWNHMQVLLLAAIMQTSLPLGFFSLLRSFKFVTLDFHFITRSFWFKFPGLDNEIEDWLDGMDGFTTFPGLAELGFDDVFIVNFAQQVKILVFIGFLALVVALLLILNIGVKNKYVASVYLML